MEKAWTFSILLTPFIETRFSLIEAVMTHRLVTEADTTDLSDAVATDERAPDIEVTSVQQLHLLHDSSHPITTM